ncbi:MAG: DUF3874 domain-containing protein, partial [Bacteroidaceae bacterium]|nr:DUF3874 domain-containing protein [Bacteroidaceae bacterium]
FADKNPKPITIREVVEIIRADQRLQVLTENHRRYRAMGDTARADAEKNHMPCYSVAVLFSGGKQQKHIVSYTGLSIVDLDHIPSERMAEVLTMVRNDPHTLLAYTTISGEGVRILARYETPSNSPSIGRTQSSQETILTNILEALPIEGELSEGLRGSLYKLAFLTVNEYYQRLTGCDYDEKCKNATRLSGMAHDPEVYYNPDATVIIVDMTKKSAGRPRKGTKIERVEESVLRELEQRGVVYAPGSHNKYISDACYMMNRYGVSLGDCTAWALDRFNDYQQQGNDVPSIVRSCYLQTEEHGTARPPKAVSDKQATVAQIEAFLAERVQLRRNVVTGFVEVLYLNENDNENRTKHSTLSPQPDFRQFTDDDRNSLWRALSKELGARVMRQDISAVVKSDFSPRYHPFEEYISSLQPWDGATDHIARLASSVTVKGDQEYFSRCFKKWLVAFIAAIFDPEEVNHEILVFIGRQGSYKSTWFHYLLPPELRQYFLPKLMSNSGITKDDLFKIAQSGLVCLEEIDNMKQRDLNQLKAITTMRTINERRSYGEFNEFHRHIASFCATGNNRFFLTDHTGNRRFLTFEVESIVPPQTYNFGYEGVYAQAYALWQQGFRYWFNEEENAEINLRNIEFEAPNKELELITKYYRAPMQGEECKFLTATDILERINGSIKEQLSTVRIGIALRAMGIERVRSGNSRGYRLVEITPDQININQKALGNFTESDVR